MILPDPKYTTVGGSNVAYQVVGDGPIDLVWVTGLVSNLDRNWEFPPIARMLERMASYSRLIMFDRRGSGLSDPIALDALPTWEHWTEDLTAVLDAAGSERSAIFAQVDGCHWGMLFGAVHPERTLALILWNPWARATPTDDYATGTTEAELEAQGNMFAQLWGTRSMAAIGFAYANDDEAVQFYAKYIRSSMTPRAAAEQMRYMTKYDLRHILPSIRVPTLVLHRKSWSLLPPELSRYVADHIPDARYIDLPGDDGQPYSQDWEKIQDIIQEFLADVSHAVEPDRVLATVMFTDIVGSTERASSLGDREWKELLAEHDRLGRAQVDRFGGKVITTTGDGVLATFAGPSRAIRCAHALGRALRHSDIEIRTGLHTGEIELREGEDIGGIAVHIASRIMSQAAPGEVICSRTVRDLAAGSEFAFEDRGVHALKGVPDEWQLYAVKQA